MALTRRAFIGSSVAATALAAHGDSTSREMPRRVLGRTGEQVSILGLGGDHLGKPNQSDQEVVSLVREALDAGVNFIDNARSYNDGHSERRVGLALRDGYRDMAFVMTKVRARTAAEARVELEASLKALQTGHIDLWQFHSIRRAEDIESINGPNGAMETALKAQQQGLIRYIGFTGHAIPQAHCDMIERSDALDTVQMPLNPCDFHYSSFEHTTVPLAQSRDLGIIAMKTFGQGNIVDQGVATVEECLTYAMGLPVSTVVSGIGSREHLTQNLEVARRFRPMDHATREALLARVHSAALTGENEPYKVKPT